MSNIVICMRMKPRIIRKISSAINIETISLLLCCSNLEPVEHTPEVSPEVTGSFPGIVLGSAVELIISTSYIIADIQGIMNACVCSISLVIHTAGLDSKLSNSGTYRSTTFPSACVQLSAGSRGPRCDREGRI